MVEGNVFVSFNFFRFDVALHMKPLCSYYTFAVVQEVAFFGASRHQERHNEADEDREQALEEEYVTPGMEDHGRRTPRRDARQAVCISAVDMCVRDQSDVHGGEQAAKGSSHGRSRDENTDTEQELITLVEARDEKGETPDVTD